MAAIAFVNVFVGATLATPVRPSTRIDEVVAWLAGINLNVGVLGTPDLSTWQLLQPYVLETLCLWEQTRVASMRVAGGNYVHSVCCLLRPGERVLASTDPERAFGELLDRVELR